MPNRSGAVGFAFIADGCRWGEQGVRPSLVRVSAYYREATMSTANERKVSLGDNRLRYQWGALMLNVSGDIRSHFNELQDVIFGSGG